MIYAIIAAGEGSRLKEEGYPGPKPMVRLDGVMLIDRLLQIFCNNDAEKIYVIINETSEALREHLGTLTKAFPIELIVKNTQSSLHSFGEILSVCHRCEDICLTTTDTVFDEEEFKSYIECFNNKAEIDGLLAVTSFIDDESPLFVDFDDNNRILSFCDSPASERPYVSGGIYCFRPRALDVAALSISKGIHRMRNFQRELLNNDTLLSAYPFSKIIDVDHVSDIKKAESFLKLQSKSKLKDEYFRNKKGEYILS